MPDCIYRFSTADKSVCLIAPAHISPCLSHACTLALSNRLSPQFKPAMRGKLKFFIQTRDPEITRDSRLELLKTYSHLNTVLVSAFEEDIVKLVQEKGSRIDSVSKAIPFRLAVGQV